MKAVVSADFMRRSLADGNPISAGGGGEDYGALRTIFIRVDYYWRGSLQMMQSFSREVWVNPTAPTLVAPFVTTQRVPNDRVEHAKLFTEVSPY
jgi:hypothetical protein